MAEFATPHNVVASEFAAVAVDVDLGANGPRLRLTDLHDGRVAYLDALELATLIGLPDGVLESWQDPSRFRWRDAPA